MKELQHLELDLGSPIVYCSIADPYAILLSEEGSVCLLALQDKKEGKGQELVCSTPDLKEVWREGGREGGGGRRKGG